MAYLTVKVSFPVAMLEARGLAKLGILYGEELALFSWCIILVEKLYVSGRIDFVADMAIDVKRSMSLNTFGMPFTSFLYLELF